MHFITEMQNRLRFYFSQLREKLWVRPLVICLLSILAAFLAGLADSYTQLNVPALSIESLETLLSVLSATMLVIAVFAVGAMLSAYASASNAATPRTFSIVVADDVSQNALSTFIGAFIYSVIAQITLMNGYYQEQGRFALFVLTVLVFAVVILGFVRWVDRIARLGRLGSTVDKVEAAARTALLNRARQPTLRAGQAEAEPSRGEPLLSDTVGYVQRIDLSSLQSHAEKSDTRIQLVALPGSFVSPGVALAYVEGEIDAASAAQAFKIGGERTFVDDPRFGLVVLSEIGSRALSPAVNDPGTAIDIIGTLLRLFVDWQRTSSEIAREKPAVEYDRLFVPALSADDLLDDAFNAIARDGAGTVEVAVRLQKTFQALTLLGDSELAQSAARHAEYAVTHAEHALPIDADRMAVRNAAAWIRDFSG